MSRETTRYVAAGLACAVLAGLLYWQHRREGMVSDCLSQGGDWDGTRSVCRLPPGRILIRPGLQRG